MEITNNAIYNPKLDQDKLWWEISDQKNELNSLYIIQKQLKCVIFLLQTNVTFKTYSHIIESDDFICAIRTLKDLWPTKGTSLSKSKTKLFYVNFDKFLIKTKKKNELKHDKLTELISLWKEELEKLDNEIILLSNTIDDLNHQYDRFVVDKGLFEVSKNCSNQQPKLPSQNRWCIDINYIEKNSWYSWPEDIELYTGQKFKPKDVGIGAGEHWLGFVLGAELQGSNSTFDLTLHNKKTDCYENWEVKEYDPKTQIVRLGSHGSDATFDMSKEITDVMLQLRSFVEAYDALCLVQEPREGDDITSWLSRYVYSLKQYIIINYDKIVIKGDISNPDLKELMTPVVGASNAFTKINEHCNYTQSQIDFCGRKIKLSLEQYSQFLLLVPEILTFDEKLVAIVSILKHPVLRGEQSYDEFLNNWVNKLKPSKAFSNVTGVFLVHKSGFMKIPLENTDEIFEYCRMSQGRRPNFKIKNIDFPVNMKQINFFGHSHFNESLKIFSPPQQLSGSFDVIGGCVTKTDDELFCHSPWEKIKVNQAWSTIGNKIKILPTIQSP